MSSFSLESLLQSLGQELWYASLEGRILEVIALLIQGAPLSTQDQDGYTPLMVAVLAGQLEIVERLLNAGADHTIRTADRSSTALTLAVINQREEIAELLLRAGADPNVANTDGISLTQYIICRDHPRMLEILLDGGASLIGYNAKEKMTNLAFAAQSNKPEAVKILLHRGAKLSDTPEDGDHPLLLAAHFGYIAVVQLLMGDLSLPLSEEALRNGSNALWVAAAAGKMELLNFLLEMGISGEAPLITEHVSSDMKRDETPLLTAIVQGHPAIIERLIAAGADVNWSRGEHGPPLRLAICGKQVEVVRVLLNAGADVHALDKKSVNLFGLAIIAGLPEMVTLLLEGGADANQPCTCEGSTALYMAAARGFVEVIKVLLGRGADIELADNQGITPIYAASAMGQGAALALLLSAGANPNASAKRELSPLIGAVNKPKDVGKCLDVVQQLLNAGADINQQCTDKELTALYYAVYNGCEEVVNYLLEHGAATDLASNQGCTPVLVASALGIPSVLALLLAAGADPNSSKDDGTSPLMVAAGYIANGRDCLDVMQQLLDAGADINAVDSKNHSSLMYACDFNQIAAVKYLLGANVNKTSVDGSALRIAVSKGNTEVVKLLLDAGADAEVQHKGLTPIQLADKCGHRAEVEVLIDWLVQRWG